MLYIDFYWVQCIGICSSARETSDRETSYTVLKPQKFWSSLVYVYEVTLQAKGERIYKINLIMYSFINRNITIFLLIM